MKLNDRVKWKGRDDLVGDVIGTVGSDLAHVQWENANPKTSWHNTWELEVIPVQRPKRRDSSEATYGMLQVVLRDLIDRRVEYSFIGVNLKRTGRLRSVEGRVALITFDRGTTMVASRLDNIRILPEEAES